MKQSPKSTNRIEVLKKKLANIDKELEKVRANATTLTIGTSRFWRNERKWDELAKQKHFINNEIEELVANTPPEIRTKEDFEKMDSRNLYQLIDRLTMEINYWQWDDAAKFQQHKQQRSMADEVLSQRLVDEGKRILR